MDNCVTSLHPTPRLMVKRGRKMVRARGIDDFIETVFSGHHWADIHISSQRLWHKSPALTAELLAFDSCWEKEKTVFFNGRTPE